MAKAKAFIVVAFASLMIIGGFSMYHSAEITMAKISKVTAVN